jgi:hypothetical protein
LRRKCCNRPITSRWGIWWRSRSFNIISIHIWNQHHQKTAYPQWHLPPQANIFHHHYQSDIHLDLPSIAADYIASQH